MILFPAHFERILHACNPLSSFHPVARLRAGVLRRNPRRRPLAGEHGQRGEYISLVADARTEKGRGVCLRQRRRARAIRLRPDGDAPARRPHHREDDAAAARSRAQPAEIGPQPEGLHDDDVDHGAREHPERHRKSPGLQSAEARAQSLEVFRLGVRHAERQGDVGLEGRGAPRVAQLHGRQRQHGGVFAALLRVEPGRSDGRPEEGPASARLRRRSRPRAGDVAHRGAARESGLQHRPRPTTSSRATNRP